MNEKTLLRAEARTRLYELPDAHRPEFGRRICTRLWGMPELQRARRILLYASLPAEVPTDEIAIEGRRRGVEMIYPRCLPEGRRMTLHPVSGPEELEVRGPYGIREPASDCQRVELSEIDVVLVPGLAWDRLGQRLGRGAGYYDRLLADPGWKGLTGGLFFSSQEVPAIPTDAWDAPLDFVVTEREIARFGPQD